MTREQAKKIALAAVSKWIFVCDECKLPQHLFSPILIGRRKICVRCSPKFLFNP